MKIMILTFMDSTNLERLVPGQEVDIYIPVHKKDLHQTNIYPEATGKIKAVINTDSII